MERRSPISLRTFPARRLSTRPLAQSQTASAAWPPRASCRCASCSGLPSLLWATASRLYGQRAALLAAGLFATLAGTQFLGAFATYDAMALFLLALAAWLGVRSVDCQSSARIALLITSGVVLGCRRRREVRDRPCSLQ